MLPWDEAYYKRIVLLTHWFEYNLIVIPCLGCIWTTGWNLPVKSLVALFFDGSVTCWCPNYVIFISSLVTFASPHKHFSALSLNREIVYKRMWFLLPIPNQYKWDSELRFPGLKVPSHLLLEWATYLLLFEAVVVINGPWSQAHRLCSNTSSATS